MIRLIKLELLFLMLIPCILLSQVEEVERLYKKATVACFFSASKLNSYYDFKYAQSILDSTKIAFSKLDKSHPKYNTILANINALQNELLVSREIAEDNLNYIYPSFSVLAGHRDDYNFIDDTEELLLEDLLQSFLDQADPLYKGNLATTSHFIIFEVDPFNFGHIGVLLDYISVNTSHYAIRPHEFKQILGEEGYDRYVKNAFLSEDYVRILNYYGIDDVLSISLSDNGSFNHIFYKGITLNVINRSSPIKVFHKYTEKFKLDKSESFNVSVRFLFFLFLTLTFIYFVLFSGFLKYEVANRALKVSKKNLLRELKSLDHLLLLGSAVVAIYIFSQLSQNIRPDINAFKGDFLSRLWPIAQVVTPMLMVFSIGFLVRYKFSQSTTSSPESLSRLIFVSLSFPYLYLEYHNSLSQSASSDFYIYAVYVLILFLLILPSITLGKYLSDLFRKNYQKTSLMIVESLNIIILIFVQYFMMAGDINYSLIFLVSSNIISLYYFRFRENEKKLKTITENKIIDFDITPNFISSGTNAAMVIDDIDKFLNDLEKNVLILSGNRGSGKTRLLDNYFQGQKNKIELFKGSFDDKQPNYDTEFGVFKNIFVDSNLEITPNFFSRNTAAVQGIGAVLKTASKVAQIDVTEVLDIEDNTTNLMDLSSDLLEELAKNGEKTNRKQILIFEDYHFVEKDINNKDFVNALIKNHSKRTFFQKYIKFIFSYESEYNIEGQPFNTYLEELTRLTAFSESELIVTKPSAFISEYCMKTDQLIVDDKLIPYIKKNLDNDYFSPLALTVYIKELMDEKYVVIDNNSLKLIKTPGDYGLKNELFYKKDKDLFDSLSPEEKNLLISAAKYGNKFNAEVLSHVWSIDLIHVIDILEHIEDVGLINDDVSIDNVFDFNNIHFFKWLKINYKKGHSNIEDQKQKEIEIDKRIIDYVFSKDDFSYFSKNEIYSFIERLINLGNRVNNYDDKLIKLRVFVAKEVFKTPEEQNGEGVIFLKEIFKYIQPVHKFYIADVLDILKNCVIQNGNLKILMNDENNQTLLEIIYDYISANGTDQEKSDMNLINLRNSWSLRLNDPANEHIEFFNKSFEFDAYQNNDKVRVQFYKLLIETQGGISEKQYDELIDSAFNSDDIQLVGEILRDRILRGKLNQKEKKSNLDFCLSLETGEVANRHKINTNNLQDFDVKSKITNALSSKLDSTKASNLSYILSRYLEFYTTKQNYKTVIDFSDYAKDIALNIGDRIGVYNSQKYAGYSHYCLGNHEDSLLIYKEYFCKMLADEEYVNEYFRDALEGILYNCKAINDYTAFDEINQLLKKEAKFLPYRLVYSSPERSLFNPSQQIIDLLPASNIKTGLKTSINKSHYDLTKSILECFIAADKDFDKAESFDLKQIILLMSNKEANVDLISKSISKKIKSIEPGVSFESSKLYKDFVDYCNKLQLIEDEYFKKQIFYYCRLLVSSDGDIHPNEQILLLKLKDFI